MLSLHDGSWDVTTVRSRNRSLRDMRTRFLGPVIMRAFDDPDVVEIYTNPNDQRIRLITHSAGRVNTGLCIDPASVLSFLSTAAVSLRTTFDVELRRDLQVHGNLSAFGRDSAGASAKSLRQALAA